MTKKDIGQPSELSIFTVAPNQVAIEKNIFQCRPVSAYNTDDTPIEISIPGQGNEYIDLRRSRLYVKCAIVKSDGSKLAPDEKTYYQHTSAVYVVAGGYVLEW